MKTLLIFALKAEAHILKQHFPGASRTYALGGTELFDLNTQYDLLKTGMGLSRVSNALAELPAPHHYERVIHFGVSGSLSRSVTIQALVTSHTFTAKNQTPITLNPSTDHTLPKVQTLVFYSSTLPVTNEPLRKLAASEGAEAVDMETYAVAEFCQSKDIPLLALRCISDRAGASTEADFRQNFKRASEKLQTFLLKHILNAKR